MHADRRDFARMNLTQILNLLRDKPGLVMPKISVWPQRRMPDCEGTRTATKLVCLRERLAVNQLILASLGFARDEVLWFFRHVEQTPPNARKGS